jgi:two-component system response regulator PilR (NtrC family)
MIWNSPQCLEHPDEAVEQDSGLAHSYDVLVVDDDPEVLVVVSLALEVFGYRVTPALNGTTALDMLGKKSFDLMVTDLMMDDIDGIALLKKTKHLYPATKVILMTGFYDPELILEAIQNHADDYLLKPFSLEVLQVKAAQCLSNNKEPFEQLKLRAEEVAEKSHHPPT